MMTACRSFPFWCLLILKCKKSYFFWFQKATEKATKKRQNTDKHPHKNRTLEKSDSCRYFFWPVGAHPSAIYLFTYQFLKARAAHLVVLNSWIFNEVEFFSWSPCWSQFFDFEFDNSKTLSRFFQKGISSDPDSESLPKNTFQAEKKHLRCYFFIFDHFQQGFSK